MSRLHNVLALLSLLLAAVPASAVMVRGEKIAVPGFSESGMFCHAGDAPPLMSSGEMKACGCDSVGFIDGPNLYAYVRQNPWTAWDPHGLAEEKRDRSLKGFVNMFLTVGKEMLIPPEHPKTWIGQLNRDLDQKAKHVLDYTGFMNGPVTQARHEKSMKDSPTLTKFMDLLEFGASQPGAPFGMLKPLPILNTPKVLAQQKSGVLRTQGTRYVGEGEAAVIAKTNRVPNTTATGESKVVFYTHDKPLNSAAEAQAAYNLPVAPTHRVTVDTRSAKPGAAGNVEGGTGIELMTDRSLPTIKGTLKKLGE